MSKKSFLMGASALVAAAASLAGAASAQVTTQTYAGGSSLVGPYLRQAYDCYGAHTPLVIKGSALNNPTLASPPVAYFNYPGNPTLGYPAQNCATTQIDPSLQLNYISTGSGTGLKGYFTHDAADFWGVNNPPADNFVIPTVDSANAETAMQAGDVTAYTSGGVDPATGLTFASPPGAGQYAIPAPLYGPMIQIPILLTPVDVAYQSTYRKVRNADGSITSYHFNIHAPRADGSGGLVLDAKTYCAIFNGQITDWNQIPLSLNGGVSLKDPADPQATFSVPLVLVGRSDSSGTTSVFTRHLAAQCPVVITGTVYPDFSSTLPAGLVNAAWTKTNPNFGAGSGVTDVPGKFTTASGSDGVADYIEFDANNVPANTAGATVTQGRIGYVGPDFALPAVANTGNNTFGLNTASLWRWDAGTGKNYAAPVSPTVATTLAAFGTTIKPPTCVVGGACPANSPLNWVQAPFKTAAIAIPANLHAYPIVGSSNIMSYTCYANATVAAKWTAFLKWYFTSHTINDTTSGVLAKAGLAAMPTGWAKPIVADFAAPTGTTKQYHLYITTAGNATASQCTSVTPGA